MIEPVSKRVNSVEEVLKANQLYLEEEKRFNELQRVTKWQNSIIELGEVREKLSYAETKKLYSFMCRIGVEREVVDNLKNILEEKKAKEYPEVNEVKYYPATKEIDWLNEDQKVSLDKMLKESYNNFIKARDIELLEPRIIRFLMQNGIIERIYVFGCGCGRGDCSEKEITEKFLSKLKMYWLKQAKGTTTKEEDMEMGYGYFEIDCWNDRDIEICSLEDFKNNVRSVRYEVIKKPNLTFEEV